MTHLRRKPAVLARALLLASVVGWLLLYALVSRAAPPIPPPPEQRVTDRVGVLSSAVETSLERRLASYEAQSGHQIIVWIDSSTGALPIETFAVEAFEAWKLGRAKLDDGLAMFVMVEDRAIRIEVGYGLESVVTDLEAAQVIRNVMVPAIETGNWDAAVVGGVEAIVDTIEGRADALPSSETPPVTQPPDGSESAPQPPAPQPAWVHIVKIVGLALLGLAFLILLITNPGLALTLLFFFLRGGRGNGGGDGGFSGGGGRSGGGGATGRW